MSWFINTYAMLIYFLCTFLIKFAYKQPKMETSFSPDKHRKMQKLSNSADNIFNIIVRVVSEKTRYGYTMPVDYDGSKLLIRPFIFSEILMVSGHWEPYVKAILDKELKSNDTIVDVGAHIGIYAIPLAKRVSKVIAFEPHPKTSVILEKSIELNRLHNVVLIKKPAGNSKTKLLYGLSTVPDWSEIITADNKSNSHVIETIETESIDLDDALSLENRVDWLLIDVVGFEVNVLNGSRNILRKYSPKIIVEPLTKNVEKVSQILTEEGYSITHLFRFQSNTSMYCSK
jgi:FkbM family methyltransferase